MMVPNKQSLLKNLNTYYQQYQNLFASPLGTGLNCSCFHLTKVKEGYEGERGEIFLQEGSPTNRN